MLTVIYMEENCTNCIIKKHRTPEEKNLDRRLKIIAGQINGISKMIESDRYCDDVLLQVASTINALKSLSNEILKSHMQTCMVEEIKKGNIIVVDDILNLFAKLK